MNSATHPPAEPIELTPQSDREQQAIGELLGRQPVRGAVILLQGDLGSGKTTLARGVLRGRGHQGPVRSPTYTLIEPYELAGGPVWHLDLYRLADPEELEYLGLRDALDGTTTLLIEWPQQGGDALPPADLIIELHHLDSGGRRLILTPVSGRGEELLRPLQTGDVIASV